MDFLIYQKRIIGAIQLSVFYSYPLNTIEFLVGFINVNINQPITLYLQHIFAVEIDFIEIKRDS